MVQQAPYAGLPLSEHGQAGVMRDILNLMVEREAEQHRAGWDENLTTFYSVCRDRVRYDVEPCRLGRIGIHPRREFAELADALEAGPPDSLVRRLYPSYPIAHFVVTEAWGHEHGSAEAEEWERERAGRMLADIVGSYELRLAFALIGHPARHLQITRRRGTEPMLTATDSTFDGEPGGMYHSLGRLHVAAGRLYQARRAKSAAVPKGRRNG